MNNIAINHSKNNLQSFINLYKNAINDSELILKDRTIESSEDLLLLINEINRLFTTAAFNGCNLISNALFHIVDNIKCG